MADQDQYHLSNGSNGNGSNGNAPPNGGATQEAMSSRWGLSTVKQLIVNYITTRIDMVRRWLDPRRDLEYECGHPLLGQVIGAETYQHLFEREPVPARVVELFPKECFQITPSVYEDEDPETVTNFEEAWDGLGAQISGGGYRTEEKGSRIWEILRRADIMSGIGCYGIILIGIDDGLDLSMPALLRERKEPKRRKKRKASAPETNPADVDPDDDEATATANEVTSNFQFTGLIPTSTSIPDERPFIRDADELKLPGKRGPLDGPPPKKAPRNSNGVTRQLRYLQVFSEYYARIAEWDTDENSPRYGMPTMYSITFGNTVNANGPTMPRIQKNVHWTRVVHVAEELEHGVFACPRMRPVLNRLLDIRKIYGPDAEGYYKNGIAGWVFQTYKELGSVDLDRASLKNEWESYENSLSKLMTSEGGEFKPLVTPIADPTPHILIQIQAICIKMGCPQRIFMGSERGELASSQDDAAWNDRLRERQNNYLSPRLIEPFIDRLIALGVLPEPEAEDGYKIWWPDLESQSETDKATIASTKATALATLFDPTKELWTRMAPTDIWTWVFGMEEEEARKVVANAEKEKEKAKEEKIEEEERQRKIADEEAAKEQERSFENQRMQQEIAAEAQTATTEAEILAEAGVEDETLTAAERTPTGNVFCPTGAGGGIDPTCGGSGGGGGGASLADLKKELKNVETELMSTRSKKREAELAPRYVQLRDKVKEMEKGDGPPAHKPTTTPTASTGAEKKAEATPRPTPTPSATTAKQDATGGKAPSTPQTGSTAGYHNANRGVPDQARPPLTAKEAQSLKSYTTYAAGVNHALRTGGKLDAQDRAIHDGMKTAFEKTKDFPEPVTVYRGMRFTAEKAAGLPAFLEKIKQVHESGQPITVPGYTSTTTSKKVLAQFAHDAVKMEIRAKRGLDARSHSISPDQDEVILNHNSQYKVVAVKQRGGSTTIVMEQL